MDVDLGLDGQGCHLHHKHQLSLTKSLLYAKCLMCIISQNMNSDLLLGDHYYCSHFSDGETEA